MNTVKAISTALAVICGLALGGCVGTKPTQTELNFGDSVRQMIRAQTYDPGAPADDDAVDGTDGPLLDNTLETYRGDVGDRDAVGNDIQVGVDGGGL